MLSLIIIMVIFFSIFFSSVSQAACRSCAGDAVCEITPPTIGTLGDYACLFPSCADCTQCGCVDPLPPPATSGGLFPLVQCGNEGQPACTLCHLFETANRIFLFIRNISFIIGGLMLVVGGIMMLISGSSIRQLDLAKKIIKNVVTGLVIIMVSFIIITSILATFAPGSATMFNLKSGAFEIECDI